MIYQESNLVELKRRLEDGMQAEIVAFLNSPLGGTIYVGVEDDGTVIPLTARQKDEYESRLINWIRDESIYPNCSDFIHFNYNEDQVLAIQIESGIKKPYYIKSKGLKPSGVYIRYGRNKTQATNDEIANLLRNSNTISYENQVSQEQDLSFNYLKEKFSDLNLNFNDFKMVTSGFVKKNSDFYTNVAYLFSDQYDIETKIAVYKGKDREIFKSKKEITGSILQQIDKTLDYIDLCNEVSVIIDGNPTRYEIKSYDTIAIREAVLNCYCHRNYDLKSNIKIEFFDDRCEIISPGNLYSGLTLEEALTGSQSFRNEFVVRLLFKLGYIENYASGLQRILKAYQRYNIKPKFENSENRFKVILPNINFHTSNIENISNIADVQINNILPLFDNIRDQYIVDIIFNNPGIQAKDIFKIIVAKDPEINLNIVNKRISKLSPYIERRGSLKTGGYYIKNI